MRLLPLLAVVTTLAGCVTPVEVGSVAPDFTATNLASDEPISFTDVYAGQVTLVNIWATWCEPCKEEIPALQELYETMGPRGLMIAAVSIDEAGPEVVREFMAGLHALIPKESDARNSDWTAATAGGGSLLAVVRNAEEPVTANPRPSRRGNSKQAG